MNAREQGVPSMKEFESGLQSTIKRYATIFLALALLGALWSTALGRISDRQTATTLLTTAGTDLINPLLMANGTGLGTSLYGQIQSSAVANPDQPVNIPFLKVQIPGREVAGKSFVDGSRVIYAYVADAYYSGGPNAAFTLPPELQTLMGNYTPFVQSSNSSVNIPGLPQSPLPQLPAFASTIYTHVGITPMTLTAAGHSTTDTQALWFWLASGVLALILILMSKGWNRLWSVAWPVFHASWHIALIGVIAAVIVSRNVAQAAPFRDVLGIIGSTFMPVFYAAALIGIIGIVVSLIGNRVKPQSATAETEANVPPTSQAMMQSMFAAQAARREGKVAPTHETPTAMTEPEAPPTFTEAPTEPPYPTSETN